MQEVYIREESFTNVNFTQQPLAFGEYDRCDFHHCDFSGADLSGFRFSDCVFQGCNLSLVGLDKTTLQDITFKDCKMLGLRFGSCENFGLALSFENCQLNHSSFHQQRLKKTCFKNCKLTEADFAETDLTQAVFDHCDLFQAIFDHTLLKGADFRTSYNYSIDPESNQIQQARFSIAGLAGLLHRYKIKVSP